MEKVRHALLLREALLPSQPMSPDYIKGINGEISHLSSKEQKVKKAQTSIKMRNVKLDVLSSRGLI